MLLPTHDPTVGRVVGAYFQHQKNEGQAEALRLEGLTSDQERVRLDYTRADDGAVQVDGYFGSVEIHQRIEAVEKPRPRPKDNKVFGQAGSSENLTDARITGSVGEQQVELTVSSRRQSREVHLTPELLQQGRLAGRFPFRMNVTPTFGGAPVQANPMPNNAPTPSIPLQTEDRVSVRGHIGAHQIERHQRWATTTWTITSNDRDGTALVELFRAERAEETESYDGHQAHSEPVIEPGRSAKAVSRFEDGTPIEREHKLWLEKGVIEGNYQVGELSLSFHLSPALKNPKKADASRGLLTTSQSKCRISML